MDEQLKQRLVGAAVLVAIAVVFIPMLLRPSPPEDSSVAAPSLPQRPGFSSSVVPVDQAGEAGATAGEVRAEPVRPVAAAPEPAPAPERAAAPAPAPEPAPGRPPAPAPAPTAKAPPVAKGEWVIQLGSFSNSRNASALAERLRAKGYPAFTRPADSARGPVTRVYVGPSPSREAAGKVVERLRRETNLRGIVVRAASV